MNPRGKDPWFWVLIAGLALSAGLRLRLVAQGGQGFWSDETRYLAAREAVAGLAGGDHAAAARALLGGADHLFFKVIGLIPAGLERLVGANNFLPGCFFAGFSVLNILLVALIARRAGAGRREAVVAALLMMAAATQFYYARHFFPYDAALSFGLLALWTGWRAAAGAGRSLTCGVLAGLGFLTYTGSWLFGAMVLIGHVLAGWPDRLAVVRRGAWAAAGLALPIGAAIALAHGLAQADLVASFLRFSRTINQGDFGGGGRLLREYFWSAEGLNAVLGLLALVAVGLGALVARTRHRGVAWTAGAVFLLGVLWYFSDVAHQFVIYGRTARMVVPLVCLAGAFALEQLWRTGGGGGKLATGLMAAVALQAAANYWAPWQQVFPDEFSGRAAQLHRDRRAAGEQRQLVTIYVMMPRLDTLIKTLPDHEVLLASPNPLQYRPYLFEGWPEKERAALEREDIRMRLIAVNQPRLDHPTDLQRPYPGVVQMTLRMPEIRHAGTPQPLLVSGETGRGDFLYLIYQADSTLRFGFDHWGGKAGVSEPVPVDFTQPVVITLSTGALHAPRPRGEASLARSPHQWLYLAVNDLVVWSQPSEFHVVLPSTITFLENYIGGSTAGQKFTGSLLQLQSRRELPFAHQLSEGP